MYELLISPFFMVYRSKTTKWMNSLFWMIFADNALRIFRQEPKFIWLGSDIIWCRLECDNGAQDDAVSMRAACADAPLATPAQTDLGAPTNRTDHSHTSTPWIAELYLPCAIMDF